MFPEPAPELCQNCGTSHGSDVAVRVPDGVFFVAVRVRRSDYGIRVRRPGLCLKLHKAVFREFHKAPVREFEKLPDPTIKLPCGVI